MPAEAKADGGLGLYVLMQDLPRFSMFRYNVYRWNCGRDQRLKEIWGDAALHQGKD